MSFYALIYYDQTRAGDVSDGIIGPQLYRFHEEAINELFSYVRSRIIDVCTDLFVEQLGNDWLGVDLFDFTQDDDNPVSDDELNRLFDSLSTRQKELVCNWYFDFANDEHVEAFFKITQHFQPVALSA